MPDRLPLSAPQSPRLLRRLLVEARPFRLPLAALTALSLLGAPLALLTPVPMKLAVDHVLGGEPLPPWAAAWVPDTALQSAAALLWLTAALVVAIALLQQVQALGTTLLQTWTGEQLVLAFRARLFAHLQRLSLASHDLRGTSGALYHIQYDATSIQEAITKGLVPMVTAAATLLAMVGVSAYVDWTLTLVALAVAPALLGLSNATKRRLRRRWTRTKELESAVMGVAQEVLGALRVVKAFGQEAREARRFRAKARAGIRARVRAEATQGTFNLLVHVAVAGGTAVVLYLGVRHVQSGQITLGDLVLILFYLAMLYAPLQTLGMKVGALQNALASAARAFAVLDEPTEVAEAPQARPLQRAAGSVAFEGVSFGYDPERPTLCDVQFEVAAGARVGVVGATGAGKTTLLSLLMRFYDPTVGRVLLDGVDLRAYRLEDLRRQFAVVLQEPVLFAGTIADNIAYGRPGASVQEVAAAAALANADGFIRRLPGGYDAEVGERGMRLSGGERQRVSLARAFLCDAPILLLDEPTSAVDVGTERLVLEAAERLMEGRTTFMISHRPDTLDRCDLIVQVADGGVRMSTGAEARTAAALPSYAS